MQNNLYIQDQIEKITEFIDKIWINFQASKQKALPYEFHKNEIDAIKDYISFMNNGYIKSVYKIEENWIVNSTFKRGILLYFQIQKQEKIYAGDIYWSDKVHLKNSVNNNMDIDFRLVPGGIIRYGAWVAKGCVILPSFINIGASVDCNTMIDTWSTVGSCAYIGKNCHISGGTGIGGVLEPENAKPVIIEDNCFIGARSEIAEGVLVEEGCVVSMGVFISASTKIINRETGEVYLGRIPKYSVVIPGSYQSHNNLNINCAIIIKTVDEKTRSKTSINELLRN
ncbi:MAG: 2,3,4,5-tetrahydropyridine-2,6-dicarboxylate N-succinyltransferase [Rickettsiales bacterium]